MRLPVLFAAAVLVGAVASAASAKVVVYPRSTPRAACSAMSSPWRSRPMGSRSRTESSSAARRSSGRRTWRARSHLSRIHRNAAYFFNKADDPIWKDPAKGDPEAKKLDYDANKIVWPTPSPANNTWGVGILKEVAAAAKLKTLSDFGKWVTGGGKVKLAASAEFVNSAAALPAFQTAYDFKLSPDQLIVLSGGDTAATIKAASDQTNGANAAMVYGTDGAIQPSGLVVLDDDKDVQPVYNPTPIIRENRAARPTRRSPTS